MAVSPHREVFIVGAGMTKFERPFARKWDYPDIGREAAQAALSDAGLPYECVEAVVASYCYGDPTCGQKAVYGLGLTGVPVFNVNNNCSSGSTALMLARSLVIGGMDCVLAVGFEKMNHGLSENFPDRMSPVQLHTDALARLGATTGSLGNGINSITSNVIKMFALAAQDHCKQYGTTPEHFAAIASKNRQHGSQNPKAASRRPLTPKQVLTQRVLCEPITIGMSAATGDGGASCVVCSRDFMLKRGLQNQAIQILSQHMVTDLPSSFNTSFLNICGYEMSKRAAQQCFRNAGMSIRDVDVIEVHDCFAPNELFMYEALGLCNEGEGKNLIETAEWISNKNGGCVCRLGGRWVVNPSGGLESKGHPIGATGLAQAAELNWQLRGIADKVQVNDARVALQQNFGIGGAAVVTLYRKFDVNLTLQSKL